MIPEKPKGLQATPDQWKAIATRGNNLLVSASAGSGKTKVLIFPMSAIICSAYRFGGG